MKSQRPTPPAADWAALDAAVRRWLGRRAPSGLVDDLAQETLLRVHRSLPDDVRRPEAWALRAAHSVLVDHLRTAVRRGDVSTDPAVLAALTPLGPGEGDRPDAGLEAEADRALDVAIARCLGRQVDALPAEQRDALVLTGPGGRSQAGAAAEAGISVPGMKSRVQRGRERVRAEAARCCAFELDPRGRPISMTSRAGTRCTCGCAGPPHDRAPDNPPPTPGGAPG